MKRSASIARSRLKKRRRKSKPGDDPKYLDFVRTLPCVICLKGYWIAAGSFPDLFRESIQYLEFVPVEAAHVGERGLGQKCPDRETVPLCGEAHHRLGPESHHVLGKRFWEHWNLERDVILFTVQRMYELES